MWKHEEFIDTTASAERLWEIFSDVGSWKKWNAGIENIEISGPFDKGARISMQPPGGNPFISTLIDVRENDSFTDETVIDATRVIVHHKIMKLDMDKNRIIYSTEITGPDESEFGPMVTGDFKDVLMSLKSLAEKS